MRTLGNIIWHIPFCGFINAICVWLSAILFAITIVGLPIAKGLFEYGSFLFLPFGHEMVDDPTKRSSISSLWNAILSILWIVFFGIWLWIFTIFQIVGLFFSIVGIPMAIVLAKSIGTFFNPVGKICVKSKNL